MTTRVHLIARAARLVGLACQGGAVGFGLLGLAWWDVAERLEPTRRADVDDLEARARARREEEARRPAHVCTPPALLQCVICGATLGAIDDEDGEPL